MGTMIIPVGLTATNSADLVVGDGVAKIQDPPAARFSDSGASFSSTGILRSLAERTKLEFQQSKQIITFPEYLDMVLGKPGLMLRPVSKYTLDAIDHAEKVYGEPPFKKVRYLGRDLRDFAFLKKPWLPSGIRSKEKFYGQLIFWNEVYSKLVGFSSLPRPNRVIMGHGPNSSGKSCGFDAFLDNLEIYSESDEGAIYTFEIAFDEEMAKLSEEGSTIGFGKSSENGFGGMNSSNPLLSIRSYKNSPPFFLFDREERSHILSELDKAGRLPEDFNKDFVLLSNLDVTSQKMYRALLKFYKGDISKVFSHVKVLRRHLSTGGEGLIVIQPQDPPTTVIRELSSEVDWGDLPPPIANALRNEELVTVKGDLAAANHGVINYDDLREPQLDDLQFWLRFAEKGRTCVGAAKQQEYVGNMGRIIDDFDVLQIATVNDSVIRNFANSRYPAWQGFKRRIHFVPMGYERSYDQISNLLKEKIEQAIPPDSKRHISPHTLDMFALWIVMTALIPPGNSDYYASLPVNEEAKEFLQKCLVTDKQFNLLHKALLYQGADLTVVGFSAKDEKLLRDNVPHITDEYNRGVGERKFGLYEGSTGYLPSDAEVLLARAVQVNPGECFSAIELLDTLEAQIKQGFDFEETRNEIVASLKEGDKERKPRVGQTQYSTKIPDFPDTKTLFDLVKNYCKQLVEHQVKLATGAIKTKEDLRKDIEKYLDHLRVSARVPQVEGGVKPEHRGSMDQGIGADETFMRLQEEQFGIQGKFRDEREFRSYILGRYASKSMEGLKGEKLVEEVFRDQIPVMEARLAAENTDKIKFFLSDLRQLLESNWDIDAVTSKQPDSIRNERLVKGILELERMGYCKDCMKKLIIFAFKDNVAWSM